MLSRWSRAAWLAVVGCFGVWLSPEPAASDGLYAPNVAEYILVGTGSQSSIGTATAVSNYELGANTTATPMSGLEGSVPALPSNAKPVVQGIGGNGDIANTHFNGNSDLSNVQIWGDSGIDCAGSTGSCSSGLSNVTYNGSAIGPGNGLNGNVDLSAVTGELSNAANTIPTFVGDHSLQLTFSDGEWDNNLAISLLSGVTVIDFDTGGNDLKLSNSNLIIDGPSDAYAIFRLPDDANFLVEQSNIVVGDSEIGLNNVLFYTDKPDNDQHIKVQDAIINGVAFWDLSEGGEITFSNVQGCTQVVADKINIGNVRINNCGFKRGGRSALVPEPSAALLSAIAFAIVGLGVRRRRA